MHQARHALLAFLLIIGIVVSTIPFIAFHKHAEIHCVEHSEDVDACHLKIYHGYLSVQESCDHNTHVHSEFEKCDWCKFVKPLRENFSSKLSTPFFQADLSIDINTLLQQNEYAILVANHYGRAPPKV